MARPIANLAARSAARVQGALTYKTERPCRRGHNERYTVSGQCIHCSSRGARIWKSKNPEYDRQRMLDPVRKEKARIAAQKSRRKRLETLAGRPQSSECEICGSTHKISFDHCHQSGKFRGWICHECNVVLGLAQDDPSLLRKLADYVENNKDDVAKQLSTWDDRVHDR